MNKSFRNFLALALGTTAVAVVGIFAPSARAQGTTNTPLARSGEIVVKVPASMTRTALDALAAGAGCRVDRAVPFSPGYYVLKLGVTRAEAPTSPKYEPVSSELNQALSRLRARPGTLADPNWMITRRGKRVQQQVGPTTDPLYPRTRWHMEAINMPLAWTIQAGIPGRIVKVAVSDSGLDTTHPDFQLPGGGVKYMDPQNVTFDPPTTDVTDTDGHGTHVAGTIAAAAGNNVGVPGVAGYTGGNVDVRIVPIKIFPDENQAPSAVDSAVAAINYSALVDCDVHNMSWGFPFPTPFPDTLNAAVQSAYASGVVFVASAGNLGLDTQDPALVGGLGEWPDTLDNVIRVSAVGPSRTLTSYSNRGYRVDIAGPGGGRSDTQPPSLDELVWSTIPVAVPSGAGVTGYDAYQGTSMAAPHVAGVAALVIAAGASPSSVLSILQSTAQPLDETPNLDPNGSSKYGAGLVDAYRALLQVVDPLPAVFMAGGLDRGASFDRSLPVSFNVIGVSKLAQASIVIRIETATIPTTVVRQYVMGTDFPRPTLAPGELASTLKPVSVPINPPLAAGRYKTVVSVTYNGQTTESIQFFEIAEKRQPLGRSLFSVPFRANLVDPNPEKAIFGSATSFILRRYDPRDPTAGGGETSTGYFTFSSTGQPADQAASFSAVAPNGTPIAFDVANPAGSIAPVGLGYWLDLGDTRTLNLVGPKVESAVGIRLSSANGGWNMIGAPFTGPVDWSSVTVEVGDLVGTRRLALADAVDQGIINGVLVGYRDGEYVYNVTPSGRFEPFQGYWVRALQDCTLIVPPPNPAVTRSQTVATPGTTLKGWRARLVASVAGDRDGQNYFGQVDGAKVQEDRHDIPKPPAGAGHAYVRFVAEKADGRSTALAYDMRAPGASRHEWTVAVSTDRENADVTLSWDGISSAPRRSRLVLKDTVSGQVIPMGDRSSYTFKGGEAGSTRMFKIAMEPNASGGPLQILNVTSVNATGSRSATGGGALNVRFTVNRDAEVQAVIRTMTGKSVASLVGAGRATSMQETTLRWDGRTRSGSTVAAGPYMLEITARSADGKTTTVKRAIQYLR